MLRCSFMFYDGHHQRAVRGDKSPFCYFMQCKAFDTIIFHAKIWKEKNHKFCATVKTNYRYQLCSARHQSPDIERATDRMVGGLL